MDYVNISGKSGTFVRFVYTMEKIKKRKKLLYHQTLYGEEKKGDP